jgi:hypothetical protein
LRSLISIAFTKGLGLLVIGGIIGAAIFMIIFQHNFSLIKEENQILRNQTFELSEDLDHLRKNEKKLTVIRQIDAELLEDSALQLTTSMKEELEKKVRDSIKIIYDKKISSVKDNILVYENLITARNSYVVLDKKFNVTVKFFTLIGTELTVWFTAKEIHQVDPK